MFEFFSSILVRFLFHSFSVVLPLTLPTNIFLFHYLFISCFWTVCMIVRPFVFCHLTISLPPNITQSSFFGRYLFVSLHISQCQELYTDFSSYLFIYLSKYYVFSAPFHTDNPFPLWIQYILYIVIPFPLLLSQNHMYT